MSHYIDEISAPGCAGGRVRLSLRGQLHYLRPDAIVQVSERRGEEGSIIYLADGKHINTRLPLVEVIEAIDDATNIGRELDERRAARGGAR